MRISQRVLRASLRALTLAAIVSVVAAAPARADLIMQVADSVAAPGGTGSFNVVLIDTGGTFSVAGFSVELSVPAASDVLFTSVDALTGIPPYIFGSLQSVPFSFDTFPTNHFVASDALLTAPGFVTLNPGDVFGLAHVNYSVAPTAVAGSSVTVSLDNILAGTSLSDVAGAPIPFTTQNGTIRIAGVPEPSTLVLGALGGTVLLVSSRRRRAKTAPTDESSAQV
jgi:PEP-CTERM motif